MLKICAIILAMLCLCGCAHSVSVGETTGEMKIAFLGDKAEDAILLYGNDFAVLIDTGLNKTGAEIVTYLNKNGIKKLDLMLITHYDKDHVGGADTILENIAADRVIGPDYTSDSKQFTQFEKAARKKGMEIELHSSDVQISFGPLSMQIDAPDMLYEQENDRSLVVRAQYGECSLLLAGDAEKDRIAELLGEGIEPCTLLKMPHHGRIEDNSGAFISAAKPQIAVITSHEEEMEDAAVVTMLKSAGAQVYLTRLGLVEGTCDGHTIKLEQTLY